MWTVVHKKRIVRKHSTTLRPEKPYGFSHDFTYNLIIQDPYDDNLATLSLRSFKSFLEYQQIEPKCFLLKIQSVFHYMLN